MCAPVAVLGPRRLDQALRSVPRTLGGEKTHGGAGLPRRLQLAAACCCFYCAAPAHAAHSQWQRSVPAPARPRRATSPSSVLDAPSPGRLPRRRREETSLDKPPPPRGPLPPAAGGQASQHGSGERLPRAPCALVGRQSRKVAVVPRRGARLASGHKSRRSLLDSSQVGWTAPRLSPQSWTGHVGRRPGSRQRGSRQNRPRGRRPPGPARAG